MKNLKEFKKTGRIDSGYLSFLETKKDVSFDINRVYYIYQVPKGSLRGHHAHKQLDQILIALNGKIKVVLDNGKEKKEQILTAPSQGLPVGKGIWHTMEWLDDDTILLVLASDYYNEEDYIRNYDEFMKLVQEGYWEIENKQKMDETILYKQLAEFKQKNEIKSKSIKEVLGL